MALMQPVAAIDAGQHVTAQPFAPEGEVGHHGQHQITVDMLSKYGVKVVEVAVHAV